MKPDIKPQKLWELFQKYKLVLLVMVVGLVLLLWPAAGESVQTAAAGTASGQVSEFDLTQVEEKLERILSRIDGAGRVSVALTVKNGVERVYATNDAWSQSGDAQEEEAETVVISTGSGTEEVVLVQQRYPAFQGAVVVCDGGGDPATKLLITQAVADLTGLGTDRISVCKGT